MAEETKLLSWKQLRIKSNNIHDNVAQWCMNPKASHDNVWQWCMNPKAGLGIKNE